MIEIGGYLLRITSIDAAKAQKPDYMGEPRTSILLRSGDWVTVKASFNEVVAKLAGSGVEFS